MTSWCLEMAQVQWLREGGARNNYRFLKHQALLKRAHRETALYGKLMVKLEETVRPTIVVMG